MIKEYSEEIQKHLKTIYDDCQQEDTATRDRQLREWRRLKLLWEGFTRVWYSEVAHDWRIWDETADEDTGQVYYDKPVNVFKAYLESIIAALSVTVPPVKCYPDDADNPLDIATAKGGDKISQLIYRHNDVALLWLHALFVYCTEGMIACYSYSDKDNKYGTYTVNKYKDEQESHDLTVCSNCGHIISDNLSSTSNQTPNQVPQTPNSNQPASSSQTITDEDQKNKFNPDDDDTTLDYALSEGQELCPACMVMMDPQIKTEKFVVTRLVGVSEEPKSRICLEVYGGLNVKIPNFAKKQKDIPYLMYSYEKDYSLTCEEFSNLRGNKRLKNSLNSGENKGAYDNYAQWARLSPQYMGEYPTNVVTINHLWIRPGKFNILDEDNAKQLRKQFPDGCKVTFVNDEFACAENKALDDDWTLSENPLSDYLHFVPLGQSLTSVQDITGDLISLVLQTIEHGISQTFADPSVLNFKGYSQTETTPGGIFPATPKSGKSLNDGFYELRTATLSPEVLPFFQNIQSLGQLTSGATPSIFGGQLQGVGGETASGYSMSRAQALQRLQNTWKMVTLWWKNIFGKVIPIYIDNVRDDERDVQRDNDGNFVNVMIRKSELDGKIGKVELEANENLPLTWGQTKDLVMQLLTNPNPKIAEILAAPENIGLIHDALGLVDFYVPGEDDMVKQYDEIKLLLNSEPIQTGDPNNPFAPSIDIDPIFDNNKVEFEICRKWIISEAGRQTKIDNQEGYENVLLHGKLHFQQIQPPPPTPPLPPAPKITYSFNGADLADPQLRLILDRVEQLPPPNAENVDAGAPSPLKPNPLTNSEAPIQNESNVQTVQ